MTDTPAPATPSARIMEKPLALIIEDDRDISGLFGHVLDIAGYRTQSVYDGKEALRVLKAERPDIVLLDLNLPGVSGSKVLEDMRADPRLQGVPVVVVTGYARVADHLPIKPELVLLKPVNLDQLGSLVQRLRTTLTSATETPWDETTHLYNRSFFSTRLAYSLQRARQMPTTRFGVMFVDLEPFAPGAETMEGEELDEVLREVAPYLKTSLRPSDTVARIDAGLFLILFEDVLDAKVPSAIASRIRFELGDYLVQMLGSVRMHIYVGAILCDSAYATPQEILQDVDVARKLARSEKKYAQYNRENLVALRASVENAS